MFMLVLDFIYLSSLRNVPKRHNSCITTKVQFLKVLMASCESCMGHREER